MNITIDGVNLVIPDVDKMSKGEIWNFVSGVVGKRGRVIGEIVVDGHPINYDAFEKMSGGSAVAFNTVDTRKLVLDSLEEARNYLPGLISGIDRIADHFEEEDADKASGLLGHAAEGMDWFIHVLGRSQELLGTSDEEMGDGKIVEVRDDLQKKLAELVESIESGSTFQPAFILREEIKPLIERLSAYSDCLLDLVDSKVQ